MPHRRRALSPRVSAFAARFLAAWMLLASLTANAQTAEMLKELKIPIWSETFDLRGMMGYKDNVLLRNTNVVASPFWVSGADLVVLRLPISGWQFSFVATGADTRYFNSQSVGSEETAAAVAKLTRIYGDGWTSGLSTSYTYENEVLDLTATETNLTPITKVLGHTFTGDWFTRKDFQKYSAEFDMIGTRQLFRKPVDSYLQWGPKLTLSRRYDSQSDFSISGQWNYVMYDTTPALTPAGRPITGTTERVGSGVAEFGWRHTWDSSNRWYTVAIAGYQSDHDNSSGYFNFSYYYSSLKLEYRLGNWKFSGLMRGGFYDYPVQQVSLTDFRKRQRSVVSAALHAERRLSKHWKVFADYSYEDSQSDVSVDHYQLNFVGMGAELNF
jgi:hypothetical protein